MKWENDTILETFGTSGKAERRSLSRDSKSMEKEQLISMIHFLVKREDERAQENHELKDMVKELRDTHKQDVKP